MKAIIIALCAILASGAAASQTWLTAQCAALADPIYPVPTTAAKPACLPAPAGTGTAPIVESNDSGIAGAWWCKASSASKPPRLYLYAVRWDAMTTAMLADAAIVALSGSKTAAMQAHLLKYQTSDIRDMCDVWGPARDRILAAKP
jgi:hypothetical protein